MKACKVKLSTDFAIDFALHATTMRDFEICLPLRKYVAQRCLKLKRLQPPCLSLQIVSLMRVAPVTEDDTLSKEPLFSKYMETLPRALDSWRDTGLTMVTHLLEGVRKVVQHNPALHQELFK